jgi:NADPH2:quinone reductase
MESEMKAVVMKGIGGRDLMEITDWPEPSPGPGRALVEVAVAGVNFMDVGVRRGIAWRDVPNPKVLGVEGAGSVVAVGAGVEHVKAGDRVAWVYSPGSYAQRAVIPADALVPLPDAIDDRTAAAVMMQGLTASHFATKSARCRRATWHSCMRRQEGSGCCSRRSSSCVQVR